jgi:hypothetical protein
VECGNLNVSLSLDHDEFGGVKMRMICQAILFDKLMVGEEFEIVECV